MFSSSLGGEKIGAVTNHGNGSYTAKVTSSTSAGSATITATDYSVSPSVSGNTTLTQTASQSLNRLPRCSNPASKTGLEGWSTAGLGEVLPTVVSSPVARAPPTPRSSC